MATVLVCDDEGVLRDLVRATLEPDGYEIFEARNGDEALELIHTVRPDLILLDMMMPGKSGLEVLAELRRDPGLAGTRVIMLTARAQASDQQAASTAGADVYMSKPFSPAELATTIQTILGRSDAAG